MASKNIFLFILFIIHVSCEQRNSLTIVIDNTDSMGPVISRVKDTAKSIVDIVLNIKSSIEDVVLVTFNDPYFMFRKRTSSGETLKQYINGIKLSGGYDCPEMSLSGIEEALRQSSPGSYLFVFTDANAKDYSKFEEVKALCQEKQSQVFIVLTGYCKNAPDESINVYDKIAAASHGQVFRVTVNDINQVLDYVMETLKDENSVMTSQVVPRLQRSYVPFNIDDKTEYAIVSASGSDVALAILNSSKNKEIKDFVVITSTRNVKVLKLTDLPVGRYYAAVYGTSEVNVIVFGRTDFTFEFGFSDTAKDSLKYTETQPITGTQTHLMISVIDPKHSVDVQTLEILDMKEVVTETLHLTHMKGPVYATAKFLPPNHMFKIAITAIASDSGNPIRRISKTPVEPIRPTEVPPTISRTENSLTAKEGSTIDIRCRILTGKPTPNATWFFKERGADKFSLVVDKRLVADNTDKVLRVLNVSAAHAGEYKCVAENIAGRDEQSVLLYVEVRPEFEITPVSMTTKEKTPVTIKCKLRKGNPTPTIKWQFRATNSANFSAMKYQGETLRLPAVGLQDAVAGEYRCVARNSAGQDERTTQLTVLVAPEIDKNAASIEKVKENTTATVQCRITKGFPIPTVTWWYKSQNATEYVEITNDEKNRRLQKIQLSNAGEYKCMVENAVGQAQNVVQVVVEAPPRIVLDPPNQAWYIAVEGDQVMKLPCTAIGYPTPKISWIVDNVEMSNDKSKNMYVDDDNALIVKNPVKEQSSNHSTTHTYVCQASNEFGVAKQPYIVYVSKFPDYSDRIEIYREADRPNSLNCSLPFSDPNSVRWFNTSSPMETKGSTLYWEAPTSTDDGNYTCRVSDMSGTASVTVDLRFGHAPWSSKTMFNVEWIKDETAITCSPEREDPVGKYEWFYQGKKIKEDTSSIDLIGWGHYVCRVVNPLGSLEMTYNVTSKKCVVEKNLPKTKNMPLALEVIRSPTIASQNLIVPHLKQLTLTCQDEMPGKKYNNAFRKFPNSQQISATCDHEDLFVVDGVTYKFSELDCKERIVSTVVPTGEQCLGENTMMMKVGFHVNGFINMYESCMAVNLNAPLYTKVSITEKRDSIVKSIQSEGKCVDIRDCCYEATQLVNKANFLFGPAEEASLKKPLNYVFYCKPKKATEHITWYQIEKDINKQIPLSTVWSGAYNYTKVDDILVPQYLWKVVKNLVTGEITAIVHSNTQAQVAKVCDDVCVQSTWFEPYGHRTYCCELDKFKRVFNVNINF